MAPRNDKRWPLWAELLIIFTTIYVVFYICTKDWKWPTQIHRLGKENHTVSKPCVSDRINDSLKKISEKLQKENQRLKSIPPPKPVIIREIVKGDSSVKVAPVLLPVKKKVIHHKPHRKRKKKGNGRGVYDGTSEKQDIPCGCPQD